MKRLAYLAILGIVLGNVAQGQSYRRGRKSPGQRNGSPVRSRKAVPTKNAQLPAGITEHFTRSRSFNIPFNLERGSQPKEVQLYYALNGGPWKFFARQDPRRGNRFRFRTVQDGDYWFATKTVEDNRRVQPDGLLKPELRVVIDTQRPKIKMESTVKPDGQLRLGWTITDNEELELRSLIVEVHNRNGGWTAVPISQRDLRISKNKKTIAGLKTWYPEASGVLHTRVRVRDRARNIAAATRRVELPETGKKPLQQPVIEQGREPVSTVNDQKVRQPLKQLPQQKIERLPESSAAQQPQVVEDSSSRDSGFVPGSQSRQNKLLDPDYLKKRIRPLGPSKSSFPRANKKSAELNDAIPVTPKRKSIGKTVSSNTTSRIENLLNRTKKPAATSVAGRNTEFVGKPTTSAENLPAENLADSKLDKLGKSPAKTPIAEPVAQKITAATGIQVRGNWDVTIPVGDRLQMTRSNRFKLQYDVDSIGPAGVAEVTLYVTNDGGKTWMKWGTDPDLKSPFELHLKSEGIYGFRIVIAGRNGLTGDKPQSGDLADLWVGVDLSKPNAKLTSARYGTGQRAGQLELRWNAVDRKLGTRPVTLSYSTNAKGPWTPIAAGIPNTGQYYWQIDRSVPKLVYLRLEVKDQAGNVTTHQHVDPIRIDGVVPKARIRSVAPIID